MGISESRHQRIRNQHKILHFFIPILIFFKKKIFWVIIALFAYLKCKCEENCTFSNILQIVKSYFFGNIYQSPFDSYWNSKKSIKLKTPSVQGGAQDPVRGEGELLSVPLLYMFCWCTGWGTGPSAWWKGATVSATTVAVRRDSSSARWTNHTSPIMVSTNN